MAPIERVGSAVMTQVPDSAAGPTTHHPGRPDAPTPAPVVDEAWLVVGPMAIRHGDADAAIQPGLVKVADRTGGRGVNTVILPIDPDAGLSWPPGCGPLFYLARVPGGWRAYAQVLYTPAELMFLALDSDLLVGDPRDEPTLRRWVGQLARRHRECRARLNNHQRVFAVHRPDEEIEHKFTLPPQVDIWTLAARLLTRVTRGGWQGWIGEYRNEFEQWDFLNHLYEIAAPASERGYVSFIPAVDSTWIIKRKWFMHDQAIRREHRDRGVILAQDADLAGEVRARFGIEPAWGVVFRRVRYDINVESLRTGHGYSVMFDRCTTTSGRAAVLQQCEVEYLRSRTLRALDDAEVLAEFEQLCQLTRGWLSALDVVHREDHLSKLSFFRAVTGQDDSALAAPDRPDTAAGAANESRAGVAASPAPRSGRSSC